MKKPVYKLLDEKGRVLIPLEMRQKAEIEKGDILKVSINTGKIVISKVDILEVGKQDAEAVEAYVNAAVNSILNEDITKTKIHIFLNILRDFTVAHIMLLEHILQLESEGKTSNEPFEEGTFPNEVTKELRDNLLEDLYYYKLVDIRNSEKRQFDLAITAKTFPKCVTKLGKEFLDFISEHE